MPRPAAEWWDDVVATCSAIRAFASQEDLDAWLERIGEPPGDAVSLEQLWRLSLSWYGDRLDDDWSPQTTEQRQAQLESNGFTGPFWALPA